ncbi:MAG: carbamoyltransferase HypF, partial [Deltaproteobacteria bacterium]|nr:carbamoyltransferase HypF [Deltaproteobacteria bacterium]
PTDGRRARSGAGITHHCFDALVMTSGNISEEPIVIDNQEALNSLSNIADAFLLHNRDIYMRVDDSVTRISDLGFRISDLKSQVSNPGFQIVRRARGYVPSPIDLGREMPLVLATGGELKTTLCLTKERYAIISQHIGDMENKEAIDFYKETLINLMQTFKVKPQVVAHDLHPDFWTTRFAREYCSSLPTPHPSLIAVQHHHAHIASCIAEHGLRGKVIGIALDGTGYGTDGKVWGGEFLIADERGFERFAHLQYIPMPGGEKAIKEPFRMALSYLYRAFGDEAMEIYPQFFHRFNQRDLKTLISMIKGGINSPLTSGCGRLFDAVSSILGIKDVITFEGEAAIALEMIASPDVDACYGSEIKGGHPYIIDVRPMIRDLIADMKNNVELSVITGKFHNTIAEIMSVISKMAMQETSIQRVVLSGGCLQNTILLKRAVSRLEGNGFNVFTHRIVPPNDGGISLGQALIASSKVKT